MAVSSKLFPAVLLLLLLATEMGLVQKVTAAEPRPCVRGYCKRCTGACFDPDECNIRCRNEYYISGHCTSEGDGYRCMCTKNC
ncbi:unnamed protein product [Alopecurus aequalis]